MEIQLGEWLNKNDCNYSVIDFIIKQIPGIFSKNREEYDKIQEDIIVIAEHTSKSVKQPVVRVTTGSGTELVLRYNFHNWVVSVDSQFPITCDFMRIVSTSMKVHETCCEGFHENWVHGSIEENNSKFTVVIPSGEYFIFTFLWILANHLWKVEEES